MSNFSEHQAEQDALTARYDDLSPIGNLAHTLGAGISTCEDEAAALAYCAERQDKMDAAELRIFDEARADANEDTARAMLSEQELATVLAALRFYQEKGMGDPENRSDAIHEIATDCGSCISLDASGIDDLCEKLNS
ncbi:hypothetical protein KM176_16560 [Pseudooceanicola sp. CBS1P-1]|uniref:Uncharacterized protein n=1 Tax=Pseudooceanicola albus TaxID=2692189 RepID=A0A6L7G737_9RHOB|nr:MULTISPECIES: hypothetical protein [Pseudooceanicola]MBT9385488.1 hypothetical protein [Pseudooceanicola endophyticus]MXN19100.1 hypothetical protein [Pseudooceanicola albus]